MKFEIGERVQYNDRLGVVVGHFEEYHIVRLNGSIRPCLHKDEELIKPKTVTVEEALQTFCHEKSERAEILNTLKKPGTQMVGAEELVQITAVRVLRGHWEMSVCESAVIGRRRIEELLAAAQGGEPPISTYDDGESWLAAQHAGFRLTIVPVAFRNHVKAYADQLGIDFEEMFGTNLEDLCSM